MNSNLREVKNIMDNFICKFNRSFVEDNNRRFY